MLRSRILTALVGLPLVVAAFWIGRFGFMLLALVVGLAAAVELQMMARAAGWNASFWSVVTPVLVALATVWLTGPEAAAGMVASSLAAWWLIFTIVIVLWFGIFHGTPPQFLVSNGVLAALASVYVAWPISLWPALASLANLADRQQIEVLAAFPLVVCWIGDTGAYFGGRFFGKKPLAPTLSPNKTVEGAVSGLVASIAASALLSRWLPWQVTQVVGVGLVVGIAGQLGDLWESALKRIAGVKDSGVLIPGHGGFLDRFDALFFALPVTFFAALLLT